MRHTAASAALVVVLAHPLAPLSGRDARPVATLQDDDDRGREGDKGGGLQGDGQDDAPSLLVATRSKTCN